LIISWSLLLLGEFASSCFRAFSSTVKLMVYTHFCFFLEALRAMSFPLRTASFVYHKFGYVVASLSLNSEKSLISFFLYSLTKLSWNRVFFTFHMYVDCLLFMLLWKTSLRLWWSDSMHGIMSIFLYLLRPVFLTDYMINFGEGTMWSWEEGIFICFRIKCSIDICLTHLVHNFC
jgi:hypothetical protein